MHTTYNTNNINNTATIVNKYTNLFTEADCLYNLADINQALDRMSNAISKQLQHSNPLLLCVMTGALITTAHLAIRLHFPLTIDYIHATRYRGTNRGGDLHWLVEPRHSLKNRNVLIIDDIMDGGLTLASIVDYCNQAESKSVHTAVLVNKKRTREQGVNFEPDFVGLVTEDRYLFGFGLDYEEYMRNAPGIYAVKE